MNTKGLRDVELINMVGVYLVNHASLNYVDLQDMVESIQSSSYRYSRMKKQVFSNLVRQAYQEYCEKNNLLHSDNDPDFAVSSSSLATEKVSSDSDIEIEESPSVSSSVMKNQITNLYLTPKPPKPTEATLLKPAKRVFKPAFEQAPPRRSAAQLDEPSLLGDREPSPISEDELEIIEEVNNTINGKRNSGAKNSAPVVQTLQPIIKNIKSRNSPPPSDSELQEETIRPVVQAIQMNPISISLAPKSGIEIKPKQENRKGTKRKLDEKGGGELSGTSTPTKKPFPSQNNNGLGGLVAGNQKIKKQIATVKESDVTFSDFGGNDKIIEDICKLLMHLKHPEIYRGLGVVPPRGFLLHGAPGCGKTLLANAIAGELKMPLLKMAATELISGISGESESNIRDLFDQAVSLAPCIIFIDEIDAITPKRETAQREMERRIVSQLLSCIDELASKENGDQVLLIGATNRIETIDVALRRAGRFDREICLGIPDVKAREQILRVLFRNLRLSPNFDFFTLAKLTPGYVGADLQALMREAAVQAVDKVLTAQKVKTSDIQVVDPSVPTQENIEKSCENLLRNICNTNNLSSSLDKPAENTHTSSEIIHNENNKAVTGKPLSGDEPNTATVIGDSAEKSCDGDEPQTDSVTQDNVEKKSDVDEPSTDKMDQDCEEKKCDGDKPSSDAVPSDSGEKKCDEVEKTSEMLVDENQSAAQSTTIPNKLSDVTPEPMEVDTVASTVECNLEPQSKSELQIFKVDVFQERDCLKWIRDSAPLNQTNLENLYLQMEDFEIALKHVQPSSKREGFATVPDTSWDDIGALNEIREELQVSILGPVKHASAFQSLGLTSPAGVLLCGPPGCGKTLLAKAVANEAGINFISVKGPELLNMYVGESERAVRQCFLRAKNSSPCVIFFDELDALCPRRSDGIEGGSTSRVVNQLLTEMDGMESRIGVFVMAATNRPDIIDPAILRPGRLDKVTFVNLPSPSDRFDILKALTKNGTQPRLADDVDLQEVAQSEKVHGFTGADLAALIREASIAAFRELVLEAGKNNIPVCADNDLKVFRRHFEIAQIRTKASVTKKDQEKYNLMKERYSSLLS